MIKLDSKRLENFYHATGTDDAIIIHTPTGICGRLHFFENYARLLEQINTDAPDYYAVVTGFNVAIIFAAAIPANKLRLTQSEFDGIQGIISGMASFYLQSKINRNPKRFKQYKQ